MTVRFTLPDPKRLAALLLVVGILLVYAPVWKHDFIDLDDDLYVIDNSRVQQGLTWSNIGWAFTALDAGFWHPLTWLSHMLDCHLFGLNPSGHHLTNLFLHATSTVLLFWVLQLMTGAIWPSVLVAALFGLHPINVESVAWIAERKNVLSTLFWMLTMWAYVKYVQRPDLKRYLAVMAFFLLGLMAKPMLVTLPCVLLLLDHWPMRRFKGWTNVVSRAAQLAKEKVPLLLLSLPIGLLAILAEHRAGALPALGQFPIGVRLGNAVVAYGSYLSKMTWPTNLVVFYPHPGATLESWKVALSIVVLSSISLLVLWGARRFPYLIVGWLWYLGTLLPVSGLLQVGGHAMADRYAYVTLIGVFVLLVWGSAEWLDGSPVRKRFWIGVSLCLLALLSMNTRRQLRHWSNGVSLFEHAIRSTDNNYLAHNNLGTALLQRGQLDEAVEQFSEALQIRPRDATVFYNLGLALKRKGEIQRAAQAFSKALNLNPRLAGAHNNLGTIHMQSNQLEVAIQHFRQALTIDASLAEVHGNLGAVLVRQGSVEAAVAHFREALRIEPDAAKSHANLGAALDLQGRPEEAFAAYRRALELDPAFHLAHYNLGMLLLEQGHLDEAARHLTEAIQLKPDFAGSHYQLGVTRMRQDKVEEAIERFLQVLKLNPNHTQAQSHLAFLREGQEEK